MLTKLVRIKKEGRDIFTFYLSKHKAFNYLPGQYCYFTLNKLKYPDDRGPTRQFTLSSSPTEKNICFTTKIHKESGYKRSIKALKVGNLIEIDGPTGTFILDENETGYHVLLAGGIGVTPFRSFIKYNADMQLIYPDRKVFGKTFIHLLYSCSTPEEIAFRKELEEINSKHKNIKLDITISKPEKSKSKWAGLRGQIGKAMLQRLIADYQSQAKMRFWICGPTQFVSAMESLLKSLNIPQNKIISEKFSGY